MTSTPYRSVTRRALGALMLGAAASPAFAAGKPRIVTMLGDSITAGTPPTTEAEIYRTLLTELLRERLNLDVPLRKHQLLYYQELRI